jgi:hypothetical protein
LYVKLLKLLTCREVEHLEQLGSPYTRGKGTGVLRKNAVSAFTGKFFVLHAGREQSGDAVGAENAPVLATESSEEKAREDSH